MKEQETRPRKGFRGQWLSFPLVCWLVSLFVTPLVGCGDYEIEVTTYDPSRTYDGYTYFESRSDRRILGVDMTGQVVSDIQVMDHLFPGEMNGFEYLDDDTILFLHQGVRRIIDPFTLEFLYVDDPLGGHHDLTKTPMDTILFLNSEWFQVDYEPWMPFNTLMGDVIMEIDMASKQIVWEWHLRDYVDPIEHHHPSIEQVGLNGVRDWSHGNTVQFIPNYVYRGQTYDAVLFNSRHLSTFWVIDHATGDILWSCGEHGMFGFTEPGEEPLFSMAHQVELLDNGNVTMFDNGNDRVPLRSRALELYVDPVAQVAQEVWSWTEPGMYDWWGGDANKLPNGNVLLINVEMGRLIEVTHAGEIVWEMIMKGALGTRHTIYTCERIPYE
jgi:hypothetical protein